ncbi:hypothetical protein [Arthrobacter sp. UYEF21]|uniref:hypothetical protein n=1 Tax=Arthrobacter sp. UYEF21 TaxID=1756364 RepID=UPI00339ACBF9
MNDAPNQLDLSALLHELEAGGQWDVEEVLFLSFNANVGFFEKGVLGLCRSMGARVSVIADAGMWRPDPLAMRGAGSEYLVGLASHSSAFHPKLVLIIAADRVLAVIGSGNLTSGGWQYNSELWSVLRSQEREAPQPLFDLAEWLEALPHVVRIATPHVKAIQRVADRLRTTLSNFGPRAGGTKLITNLDHSMLSQLPTGPVDELILAAPFIDDRAAAVEALVKHFPSPKLTIIVQPGLTVVTPDALAQALKSQPNVSVVMDESGFSRRRYRHAKLIEWRRGTIRQALTGSANLSAAAMLNPARTGGNVELGLLTNIVESLWPDPVFRLDDCVILDNPGDIPAMRIENSDTGDNAKGAPQLLSAVFAGNEIVLELARPASILLNVEYVNNPLTETWKRLGLIAQGEIGGTFPAGVLAENALLRLSWHRDGSPGQTGAAIPASVPERLRLRPARAGKSVGSRIRSRDDLLGQDLSYLDAFAEQLSQIQEDLTALKKQSSRTHSQEPPSAAAARAAAEEDVTPWLWELEQVAMNIHGPVLSGFALGLPTPIAATGWESFDTSEAGDLDADSTTSTDGPVALPTEENDQSSELLSHHNDPDRLKKIRRDRIEAFAEMTERLSAVSYLGLARLALCFYCAGNWAESEASPIEFITTFASKALAAADTASLRDEADALTAVALTSVRRRVDFRSTSALSQEARKLKELGHRITLDGVPRSIVMEYTRCLSSAGGRPLEADDVYEEIQALSDHSILDEAVLAANGHNYGAEVVGPNLLQLSLESGDPIRAALSVLSDSSEPVGVRAFSKASDKRALVLWCSPDLYCIEFERRDLWTHYRAPQGPRVVLNSMRSSEASRFRVNHGPFVRPITEAKDLAKRLGISIYPTGTAPRGTCPNCFMVLPRDGVCSSCE